MTTDTKDVFGSLDVVYSVNGKRGEATLTTDDIGEGTTHLYYPLADETKLANIENNAEVNNVNDAQATFVNTLTSDAQTQLDDKIDVINSSYTTTSLMIADEANQKHGQIYQADISFYIYNGIANGLITDYTLVGGEAGALIDQGVWNASTNTPNIIGTTTNGYFWRVSVAGNTDLGGIDVWGVDDWAVKTESGWDKADNQVAVEDAKTGYVLNVNPAEWTTSFQSGYIPLEGTLIYYDEYYYRNNTGVITIQAPDIDTTNWEEYSHDGQHAYVVSNISVWTDFIADDISVYENDVLLYNGVFYINSTGNISNTDAPDIDTQNWDNFSGTFVNKLLSRFAALNFTSIKDASNLLLRQDAATGESIEYTRDTNDRISEEIYKEIGGAIIATNTLNRDASGEYTGNVWS